MLLRLHIENIAVIENADLELEGGFNVLTGETGAGKSILIDSINLALGERVSKEIVRSGTSGAHVSAVFAGISQAAQDMLTSLGYECDDDLLIQREISADGRGSCRISGRPATVSILRSVGRLLVNIHGQHDNQTLLSPEKHVYYLDKFANLGEMLDEYSEIYRKIKGIQKELAAIQTDAAQKERRIDLLKYQIEEIETANLSVGEEDELRARKVRIANAEKISAAINGAYSLICGGEDTTGAQELLSSADEALDGISEVLPDIEELAGRIKSLSYEIEDCAEELRKYTVDDEDEDDDLDYIEERLDTIFRLKRKYGGDIEAILDFLNKSKTELEDIETSDERAVKLSARLDKEMTKLLSVAAEISKKRREAAEIISSKIKQELQFLDMPGVDFSVSFNELKEPAPNGCENVEFLISANPGSPARPLAKIASGGEISRIMLAIKTVLAKSDDIDTLIFDEVDTGVSGRAAQKIGTKLKQVSADRQVVCVTHLAQIAAQADRHILIEKQVDGGNTFTHLKTLDVLGRKQELARIIAGADITEKTLQTAGEMLSLSGVNQ
jgi:DNA repair protein RecN (Recombination protein N)